MSFPHITLVWYNMSFWSINLRLHNIILMYWHDQIMIIITVVAWGHTGHTYCWCLPWRSLPWHPRIIIGTSKQPDIFTNKLISKFWASWKFTDITNFFFMAKVPPSSFEQLERNHPVHCMKFWSIFAHLYFEIL